jgi:glycosyltransferase involved in cell wall biosynthesis
MVIVSCSAKLHAFALAEQLNMNGLLDDFYTTYASQKNEFLFRFVRRLDKEKIPLSKIHTNSTLAFPIKFWQSRIHIYNNIFDELVSKKIKKSKSQVFIGWSGMSLKTIRKAKMAGMKTIVERGSSHIEFQNEILTEEYARYGMRFKSNPAVIKKELQEYAEADYISVPSNFVKKTFLDKGIQESKLFLNPYGVNLDFTVQKYEPARKSDIFRVLYLGALSFRKGLPYLFEALDLLTIPSDKYEVVFIGRPDDDFKSYCDKHKKENWKFLGHIDHYDLPANLRQTDVAVIPSIEDGFGMVIPQIMAGGIPVITTTNTGANDLIDDGVNGYIVPIRDAEAIARRIEALYNDPQKLAEVKIKASEIVLTGNTWNDYGNRYVAFLKLITSGMVKQEKKKTFFLLIYNHQEYYPPTLNAIDQLSEIAEKVIVLSRNNKLSSWVYPENVSLFTSGDFKTIRESETESTGWKIKSFWQFTKIAIQLSRKFKPEWVLCYDSIPLLTALLIRKLARIKFKLWYHNHDVFDSKDVRKFSIGWLAAWSEQKYFDEIELFTLPSRERTSEFQLNHFRGNLFFIPNYPSRRRFDMADLNRIFPSALLRLIFQGFIGGGHGLEELIDFISIQDSMSFTIIGPGDQEYVKQLKERIQKNNATEKIIIRDAIPYQLLIEVTRLHHIGIAINKPVNIQYSTAALASNKIYEYAACGLPVVYFENEHYKTYLSKFDWAFANNLSFGKLNEQFDYIREHYTGISGSASMDFREKLNFELVFNPVKEFLISEEA